ncbi:helix-turn-helix transcriptional regulator [Sphingopyxis macrogoltabida]|uniref:helix-turn-helix transcriptional regulator n=1 Tax=Sphingopyxis macrogoltabida TaxID=33050 RepID=UPI00142895C3|nr:helix-turn-helix transcriptional regulator [Sphingopyxis macrogoltabida]
MATSDAAFRGGACPTPEYTIAYTGNYTTSADANGRFVVAAEACPLAAIAEWLEAFHDRFKDDWGRTAQQAASHAEILRSLLESSLTAEEVLAELRSSEASQRDIAHRLGITPSYLSDVLNGRRDISDGLAARLGFERITTFRRAALPSQQGAGEP